MRIYTRTGDDGTTGTLGGARVSKASAQIEAQGALDELNSTLGLALTEVGDDLRELLLDAQRKLFVVGGEVSAGGGKRSGKQRLTKKDLTSLEAAIDRIVSSLPAQKSFVLPGGTKAAAMLQVSRTVCRRAERCLVALAEAQPVQPLVLAYVNRLSDLLFVMARAANVRAGQEEAVWGP